MPPFIKKTLEAVVADFSSHHSFPIPIPMLMLIMRLSFHCSVRTIPSFVDYQSIHYNIRPSVKARIIVHARERLIGSAVAAEVEVPGSKPGLLSMLEEPVGERLELELELVEEVLSVEVVVDELDDCGWEEVEREELDEDEDEEDEEEVELLLDEDVALESAECEANPMRELSKSKTV